MNQKKNRKENKDRLSGIIVIAQQRTGFDYFNFHVGGLIRTIVSSSQLKTMTY